jgi:phosphatidylserine decarboxylase
MRIATESLPFAVPLGLAGLLAGLLLHPVAALPPLLLLAFTLWFFRDPERVPPADPEALVSPADGKVLRADAERISIFMNVFDVHVCRSPMDGRLGQVRRFPGRFLAAYRDAAAEHNERVRMTVGEAERRLEVTLVAGLVARRIVVWVPTGRELRRGERVGLIRFGSRVDVDLPPHCAVSVRPGQRVRAGETTIARFASPGR